MISSGSADSADRSQIRRILTPNWQILGPINLIGHAGNYFRGTNSASANNGSPPLLPTLIHRHHIFSFSVGENGKFQKNKIKIPPENPKTRGIA